MELKSGNVNTEDLGATYTGSQNFVKKMQIIKIIKVVALNVVIVKQGLNVAGTFLKLLQK